MKLSKTLKRFMLMTDIGFILYWSITFLGLIPKAYQYQDYTNELLIYWNLSFLPLDLIVSITGLMSIHFYNTKKAAWLPLCIVSLSLTFCTGLQAIAFWGMKSDFDLFWWTPNLFLMAYPLLFLPAIIKSANHKSAA